jgi:flavin reductase (DIM6/NTAB) family NADH-FMN oxidoreductase RutF
VLNQTGHDYARRFGYRSGRDADKFEGLAVHRGEAGVLLLDDALVTMQATVMGQMDAVTHTLFLADVTNGEILQEGDPMTYAFFRASK